MLDYQIVLYEIDDNGENDGWYYAIRHENSHEMLFEAWGFETLEEVENWFCK